ncbi:MAG TPA: DUF3644 domain-containing protein [Rhizomicrobium sp.]|jgi:hypothetical protein|nr:DUF3644 domain-containing protein [Rhizomicrobium sp.]
MAQHNKGGGLTVEERRIVKALLAKRWRNQDIQALINSGGRKATVNSGRITGVKQDKIVAPASDGEVEIFISRKQLYDPATGLNAHDDERLVRAREAMILAVQVFNGPSFLFKTELFAVLANIAWTYLLHEYYSRKKTNIIGADGKSLALSNMIDRPDCPLSAGMKRNLHSIKKIRDEVEHLLLKRNDSKWCALFQACCLNFDATLRKLFGDKVSLQRELSFALQFAKLDFEQIIEAQKHDVSPEIDALDARLREGLSEEDLGDLEYQFRVVYTFDNATKASAHIQFIQPDSDQADAIRNVLLKYKLADEAYPYKPTRVVELVAAKSGKKFTSNNHAQAWHLYKARPKAGTKQPGNTNREYCIYHAVHRDYTYSDKWVQFLAATIVDDAEFAKIKAVKL